jgi:hypothetical protein
VADDLDKASRNARGMVEYSADFYILKPVDVTKGNARCSTSSPIAATRAFSPVSTTLSKARTLPWNIVGQTELAPLV